MFNKKICVMKGKRVIHWGRAWGNGGTVQIASWKCNLGIYLDIQVITTLLFLLLVLYVLVPSIYLFFYLTTALLKSDVFQHWKAYSPHSFQPTGVGLGSLWRWNRCVLQFILAYLYICSFFFFKVAYFVKKKRTFPKILKTLLFIFFQKEIIGHMYICAKCNDNFKFTISLKSYQELSFAWVPLNACLFSITCFLYGWQKIFTNKNIFSKHDLCVLFISFFCKMYNKEKLFTAVPSP